MRPATATQQQMLFGHRVIFLSRQAPNNNTTTTDKTHPQFFGLHGLCLSTMSDPSLSVDSGVVDLISSFLGSIDVNPPPTQPDAAARDNTETHEHDAESELITDYDSASVRVVIFSKDRPWQLQQLLQSMKLSIETKQVYEFSTILRVDIFIIIHTSCHQFRTGYCDALDYLDMRQDGSDRLKIHLYFEGETYALDQAPEPDHRLPSSFSRLLKYTLTSKIQLTENTNSRSQEIVMFLTDDCLLLESLETILDCAVGSLQSCKVFNFLSRLHPGISWSQTRDVPSPPPRNQFQYHSLHSSEGVYLYNRDSASIEWNYPFDLSGGVYRRDDVLWLIENIGPDGLSHPNFFELRCNETLGNKSVWSAPDKTLSAIPTRPMLVILAVNRVQDICNAPLAISRDIGIGIDPSNAEDLQELVADGSTLDVERYRTTLYNTSHIGDFFLKPDPSRSDSDNNITADTSSAEKLSVLIPVRNGPPDAASHAIISIMMQPFDEVHKSLIMNANGESDLLPMQIVVVDDSCTDGSIDAMVEAAMKLATILNLSLSVRDSRPDSQTTNSSTLTDNTDIIIDVITSPQSGVASALNLGLKQCRSELVGRMDVDDISAPYRLLTQIRFMHANPSFDVVGTSTVRFSTQENEPKSLLPYCKLCHDLGVSAAEECRVIGTSLFMSDPGFLAWSMLFSCTIQHPSVMYRKRIIQNIRYDENVKSCEDYDVWLRLLSQYNCKPMTNLPLLGVWHRKHGGSKSSRESTSQKEEADLVCCKTISQLFEDLGASCDMLTLDNVSTLRNLSCTTSPAQVDAAAFLLECIEHAFIKLHLKSLTPQEISFIHSDVDNRILELAERYVNQCLAWKIWCKRCPDRRLEMLSLLCYSDYDGN